MKWEQLTQVIERMVPSSDQESWDNCGSQIAYNSQDINRILVCLEINEEVIKEAIDTKAEMIISHHPLIFGSIRHIDHNTAEGKLIIELIKNGISVYSTHTPFDKLQGGNNDFLADLLELEDVRGFQFDGVPNMIGRVGTLSSSMSFSQFISLIREKLAIPNGQLTVTGDRAKEIKTVGICAGAGADMLPLAAENGCHVMLTGDVKYHQGQQAKAMGICVVDAGHYGTEKFFAENFSKMLNDTVGSKIEILQSKINLNPFKIL